MYRTKRHVPPPSNSLWSVVFIFSVCTVTNRQQVCFSFVRGCAFCCLSVSVAVVVLLLRRKFFPFVSESPCERCGRFGDVPSVKPEVRTPCSSGCRLPLVKQKTNRRQLSFSSAIPSYEQNLTALSVCLLFFSRVCFELSHRTTHTDKCALAYVTRISCSPQDHDRGVNVSCVVQPRSSVHTD